MCHNFLLKKYLFRKWRKQQQLPTHAEKTLEYVENVLLLVQKRKSDNPKHTGYRKIVTYLQYVQKVLTKPDTDRSKLHKKLEFATGGPAGEIFEREDPELWEAIGGVLWIASQIGHGLKMDLNVLEEFLQNKPFSETKR